ncbi:hypothetical protein Chor_001476 [Crotalus horridus]
MIDPVENNFFGLPEYEHTRDETFQPLPPPGSPGSAEDALLNGDPEGDQLPQSKNSSVTARRAVKRTIPKLDAQRLISERGLPALCNLFDNIKFKGKGHEEADLKTLMRHMEHWAHRLFPQLQFEKVVDKIESLGNKKPVQNAQNESGSPSLSPALTEEQQQRIEWNRQRALERRQAKNQLSQSQNDELPTNEEYGTITAQEKDDICIDKAGVPFQATENMQVV